ncbi:MAG: hypothetical protein E7541_01225 [Ruminococcaceae bacterium]|nr:hypothetical protein [Oscillospiraceae bacterium]
MAKKSKLTKESIGQWFREIPSKSKAWLRSLVRPTAQQKEKRSRFGRRLLRLLVTVLLVGVISVCIVGSVLVVYVMRTFDAESYLPELGKLSMDARSVIYVQNKEGAWEPHHNLMGGNSVWVDLDEIPINLQNALIAIEDERFWEHDGVDWQRTVSAMANLFLNRVFHLGSTEYGGSTITQQLIRVTTQNKDHSIERKINEILAAIELERTQSSKQQVLEAYLNNLPLTGDLVGVGIGARSYFGKEVQELSLAESAVLVAITNNPSIYDPYQHPENVRQRQRVVLAKMYELNMITRDEYVQAINEELVFRSSNVRQEVQDYYVDLVVEDVIQDLMDEFGYTYNYAENIVYYGGLSIYSAEDPTLQAAVEAIYADEKNYPKKRESDEEQPQAGFFAVDYTGRVVATVGGRGEKTANRVLNRSTQSRRSPGSSIKPLTSYGPAVALDLVHYSSPVRDAPLVLPNGSKWPHNYEMKSTPDNGDVLLGVALQKSLNTVAARLVDTITPRRVYDEYATSIFHLSTLVENKAINGRIMTDVDLAPLALGAFTEGVTMRDMAAAYAVFGSGGYYNKPYSYYKVLQGEDETTSTLLVRGPSNQPSVLDAQTCYVMVKLMQRVTLYGTAADVGSSWKGWEIYGKTGTSENQKDVYFAGGTAYYAATGWFGYDNNQVLLKSQTSYARKLWNQAMKALHTNKQIKTFTMPEGVVKEEYCTATGLLATVACPKHDTGYYKSTNIPGYCTVHEGAPLGSDATGPTTAPTGTGTTTTTGTGTTTTGTGTTTTTTGTGTTTTAGTTTTTTEAVSP